MIPAAVRPRLFGNSYKDQRPVRTKIFETIPITLQIEIISVLIVYLLTPSCPSNWSATADLTPGEYRCRYYGGDDRMVTYCGAATTEGSIMHGLDALLLVKRPDEKPTPQLSRV